MKTIAHISDLHFGTDVPEIAAGLLADLHALAPSLVVVSGDLTQRARRRQFLDAHAYLARLPQPQLTVPGNHDVPLYDVARRFLAPLARYRKIINADVDPVFMDDELFVAGLNTARSFTWQDGRISLEQICLLKTRLAQAGTRIKIVVTHHPFIPPPGGAGVQLVGRAAEALIVLDEQKVDLLLAGHLHHGYVGDTRTHYPAAQRAIVAAQAGTAISHRTRDEANAYNVITLDREHITIEVRAWTDGAFTSLSTVSYARVGGSWELDKRRLSPPAR